MIYIGEKRKRMRGEILFRWQHALEGGTLKKRKERGDSLLCSRLKVSSSLQNMDSFPDFFRFDRDSLDALVWSSETYLLIFDLFGLGYSVFTFHFY